MSLALSRVIGPHYKAGLNKGTGDRARTTSPSVNIPPPGRALSVAKLRRRGVPGCGGCPQLPAGPNGRRHINWARE